MKYNLITPEGTKDIVLDECFMRRDIEYTIRKMLLRSGYREVITPEIEFYDVFNSDYFAQEDLYKLFDQRGRILVLRPDSTMPIARLAATKLKDAPVPLRLFYIQDIFVNNAPHSGKSNRISQMGAELIGIKSKMADIEMLANAIEMMGTFCKKGFNFEISDVGYYNALIAKLDIDERHKEKIRKNIEQKNYPALNSLLDNIAQNEITDTLKELPKLFGSADVFKKARSLYVDDEINNVLCELENMYNTLKAIRFPGILTVDLGMVTRLDYYTGLVFKGYAPEVGDALLFGGRYDKLLSEFGNDAPAIGYAVNIDSLVRIAASNLDYPSAPPSDCLIYVEKGFELAALKTASELRKSGKRVEFALLDDVKDARELAKIKKIKNMTIVTGSIQNDENNSEMK